MIVLKVEQRSNQNGPLDGHPGDVLDDHQVRREIELAQPGDELVFVGGEPTLNPDLLRWLHLCTDSGHPTALVTNGMRFADPAYARAAATMGLDRAVVSLHTAYEEKNDLLVRTPGAWKLALQGIRTLYSLPIPVAVRCSLCQINRDDLPGLIRLLNETFDKPLPLVVEIFSPETGHPFEKEALSLLETVQALDEATDLAASLNFPLRLSDRDGPPLCLLPGKERFFDRFDAIRNDFSFQPEEGFQQGPPCMSCVWRDRCSGIKENTIRRFGWDGLRSVLDAPSEPGRGRDRPARGFESAGRRQVLDFSLGSHCVNDCLFCVEGGKSPRREIHDVQTVETIMRQADDPSWVTFAGGEPTLNPSFFDVLQRARRHGAKRISVVSNGCRFVELSFLQKAVDSGLSELRLSVHGVSAGTHDALTCRKGSFEDLRRACANVRSIRQNGEKLSLIVQTCVNRENMRELGAMHALLSRWGVNRWSLNVIEPAGSAIRHFDDLVPKMSTLGPLLEEQLGEVEPESDPEIRIDSLPACVAPNLRTAFGLRTTISKPGLNGALEVEEPLRGKSFGPPCETCTERGKHCEGVWNEYIRRFGWEEFEPLED